MLSELKEEHVLPSSYFPSSLSSSPDLRFLVPPSMSDLQLTDDYLRQRHRLRHRCRQQNPRAPPKLSMEHTSPSHCPSDLQPTNDNHHPSRNEWWKLSLNCSCYLFVMNLTLCIFCIGVINKFFYGIYQCGEDECIRYTYH